MPRYNLFRKWPKNSAGVVESQEDSTVEQAVSLSQHRAYMKLPLEERRRRLAAQADRMVEHYEQTAERSEREVP